MVSLQPLSCHFTVCPKLYYVYFRKYTPSRISARTLGRKIFFFTKRTRKGGKCQRKEEIGQIKGKGKQEGKHAKWNMVYHEIGNISVLKCGRGVYGCRTPVNDTKENYK